MEGEQNYEVVDIHTQIVDREDLFSGSRKAFELDITVGRGAETLPTIHLEAANWNAAESLILGVHATVKALNGHGGVVEAGEPS